MLYKTLAKLLYKLRCENYFTQVKPHQSVHPAHAVAWTWHPTLQRSYLQTHHCRVSSERINLAYNATKSVCLAQLIHPRKLWNIQLLKEKKPTLEMVQQQHLQVTKFIIIKFPPSHSQYSGMMVPYVDGLKMDWTADDALHSRFIRWKIKCKNILDCELAILEESTKCKKVIQWSGDAGLDMYISWVLPTEEVTL